MKKKIIIVLTLSILIIGIVITFIIANNKSETKLNNNQSSTNAKGSKSDENNQITNTDKDEKKEEKNLEENKEVKQEESNKNNNDAKQDTKKEETKKNNSTNNTLNNTQTTKPTQQPKPQETTPAVTETKYYAQCSLGSLESGKQLTESQIKAKYPVGESSTLGQGILHSDLDKIAPQTGLSRDAFDAYQGACKWISTDNKNILGYTMIVHIAITNNFEKWKDINIDLYNNYKNAYNSLAYKNWDSSHRIIGEYYLNNHQWKWNPNNLHF